MVTVPVTVTDSRGGFVAGLRREDFRLTVDGAEQPIEYFSAEEAPADVVLLIETGPAVFLLRREHVSAAATLVESLAPDDRVAIAGYSDAMRPLLGWTADKNLAASALGSLNFGLGMARLNFYDALSTALDWTGPAGSNASRAQSAKRAVVVLSTGLDSSTPDRLDALMTRLRQSNVMVVPVVLGTELRAPPGRKPPDPSSTAARVQASFEEWDRALRDIAAETGGHFFFPRTTQDFLDAYRRIAALLRHEYSLGFAANQSDSRYHSIEVRVTGVQGRPLEPKDRKAAFAVNARRGFLAYP